VFDTSTLGSCAGREPYALNVLGNSMEPEFPAGTIVIIDPTPYCEHGNYVFIETGEEERWFRQFVVRDDKMYMLALHGDYPDIELTKGQFKILGVIVQSNIKRKIKHYNYHSSRCDA